MFKLDNSEVFWHSSFNMVSRLCGSKDSNIRCRRNSHNTSPSHNRPRLLRSAATEPAVTVSNATPRSPSTTKCSQRATEILNKVAYHPTVSYPGEKIPLDHTEMSHPTNELNIHDVDLDKDCDNSHLGSPEGSASSLVKTTAGLYTIWSGKHALACKNLPTLQLQGFILAFQISSTGAVKTTFAPIQSVTKDEISNSVMCRSLGDLWI